jgi:hypothetical protein
MAVKMKQKHEAGLPGYGTILYLDYACGYTNLYT